MARAFVFPGQGSQVVGMGKELAEGFKVARAVFDEVDEALGEKLSELIFDGDQDTLTLTENAQPALMASLATPGTACRTLPHIPSSPGTAWANTRPWRRPARSPLPTPPACCAVAASPCRRPYRSDRAPWRRCWASTSTPPAGSRSKRRRRTRSVSPPTTTRPARWWSAATRRRWSARSAWPRIMAPSAACCCRSAPRSIAR